MFICMSFQIKISRSKCTRQYSVSFSRQNTMTTVQSYNCNAESLSFSTLFLFPGRKRAFLYPSEWLCFTWPLANKKFRTNEMKVLQSPLCLVTNSSLHFVSWQRLNASHEIAVSIALSDLQKYKISFPFIIQIVQHLYLYRQEFC